MLTRAGPVVFEHPPPLLRFFADISAVAAFGTPVHTPFAHMLWKFQAQVTSSDITSEKVWVLVISHSYTECPITLNFSELDICYNSIYKMYVSELLYRWPKVSPILRLLHCKSMGEKWKAPLLEENHSKHSQTSGYRLTWHPESEYCDQSSCRQGHFRSWKVISSFPAITFDRDKIERWKHNSWTS